MLTRMTQEEAKVWLTKWDWGPALINLWKANPSDGDKWLANVNLMRKSFEPGCPECGFRQSKKTLVQEFNGEREITKCRCENCGANFYVDQNGNEVQLDVQSSS